MSTNNFYPFKWVKKALWENLFVRATKQEKNAYAYVIWANANDTIWILVNCRHKIISIQKHNNADSFLFRSLSIHKKKGGKIDWSLAVKDNLF